MKYPQLNQQVSYIRADEKSEILEGSGIVQAIFLDPNGRTMAQVKDGENAYNVDLIAIDASEGAKKRYIAMAEEVARLSKEGNKLAQEIVSKYNDLVEDEYRKLLGGKSDKKEDGKEKKGKGSK